MSRVYFRYMDKFNNAVCKQRLFSYIEKETCFSKGRKALEFSDDFTFLVYDTYLSEQETKNTALALSLRLFNRASCFKSNTNPMRV